MRILSKYDLFIFDWDHTLATSTLIVKLLHLLGAKQKRKSWELARNRKPSEFSARDVAIREKVDKLYAFFDDIYGYVFKPRLKQDAMRALELLKQNGKKVAIFSDSKAYRLLNETRLLGVIEYVDFALSAESVGYFKPDPTGLLVLVDRFKVPKDRVLYIGDMAGDVITAKLAETGSCAVADGLDSLAELENEKPDYLFAKMNLFVKALEE